MCIAVPGRIISIDAPKAKVDFSGNIAEVHVGLVDPAVGDYVLVHAGCAIEVMAGDKALELLELFRELEAPA
jgi:hydrogenase expression/formation protein HypC